MAWGALVERQTMDWIGILATKTGEELAYQQSPRQDEQEVGTLGRLFFKFVVNSGPKELSEPWRPCP